MGNQLRYRSGQVQLIKVRVDSGTVIEAGDLVFLDADDVKPASGFEWDTDLETTQASFAAMFLGVAHQCSGNGDTDPVSVDVSPNSVYEFDVAATTYEVGDLMGPDEGSSELHDQQLESVASGGLAIARAAEYRGTSSNLLRVNFASAFHTGSANVNAQIG
ncbi:hypothetical protein Pla110_06790 [Polystyrenella longa]|uniref:Uncharacterized protein n=1 Tax=Polystyrenella longa TaxID=2528007 RepID=A0A518CIC4_9PLAN|nr:hypothetical protein [Polystyrenella longa]QDU78975.1 hypothetical protein Pla110_06790 [Polystyrenella longa]